MKLLKYLGAFVAGYVAAILPILTRGVFPSKSEAIAALVPATLATHLLDLDSPRSQDDADKKEPL